MSVREAIKRVMGEVTCTGAIVLAQAPESMHTVSPPDHVPLPEHNHTELPQRAHDFGATMDFPTNTTNTTGTSGKLIDISRMIKMSIVDAQPRLDSSR